MGEGCAGRHVQGRALAYRGSGLGHHEGLNTHGPGAGGGEASGGAAAGATCILLREAAVGADQVWWVVKSAESGCKVRGEQRGDHFGVAMRER